MHSILFSFPFYTKPDFKFWKRLKVYFSFNCLYQNRSRKKSFLSIVQKFFNLPRPPLVFLCYCTNFVGAVTVELMHVIPWNFIVYLHISCYTLVTVGIREPGERNICQERFKSLTALSRHKIYEALFHWNETVTY